ncbi:hypothetical protein BDP55DRAFT_699178 [Colletotrichum godetiae]|uniref:Major facilitator superfamily transporter n=1 Tax=Colletotrichum godetiae TaxID=1209918 RepID=A0AAJ0A9U4_9PEZI|nr:uncharacterized protein BDP55DRAFT_699178 [Colletotrichum godetiae]KAK1657130.1 hypothetical protein BDP55DRAFT_699178 [Colletotrichum godetiae]
MTSGVYLIVSVSVVHKLFPALFGLLSGLGGAFTDRLSWRWCVNFSFFPLAFNLPIYFQAVNGVLPLQSDIRLLPTILPLSNLFSAPVIVLVGWNQPYLMTVIIANAITPNQDNSTAMSDVLFFQFIGGTFGIGMAQAIFNNGLISSLPELAPMVSPAEVLGIGVYDSKNVLSGDALTGVLKAYMRGLHNAWAMSIAGAAVAVFVQLLGAYMKLLRTLPKTWDEKPTLHKADAWS